MRILLDTCVFLWLDWGAVNRIAVVARQVMEAGHELALSDASLWEMSIKARLGKLPFASSVREIAERHAARGLLLLPMERRHIYRVESMPMHHKDPFDRMIAAQALTEDLTLVSADSGFDAYGVRRLWE